MQVNLIDWRKKQHNRLSSRLIFQLVIISLFSLISILRLVHNDTHEQQQHIKHLAQLTAQKEKLSSQLIQLKENQQNQQQQQRQHNQMLHKQQQIHDLIDLISNKEQSLWFHHITLNQQLQIQGAAFNYRDILLLQQRIAKRNTSATIRLTTAQANTPLSSTYLPHFTFNLIRLDDVNPLI